MFRFCVLTVALFIAWNRGTLADDGQSQLKVLLAERCEYCHNNDKANGEVNFETLETPRDLQTHPALNLRVLEAIDSAAMPPASEERLNDAERTAAVRQLKSILKASASNAELSTSPLHRLNRVQYNNTVRDLFQLNRDIYELPEKLMTRNSPYLQQLGSFPKGSQLPDEVLVTSLALHPQPGLADVKPFPKDLRAEHGYNNQADQLTLSPLLLDSFLRLSVSIVESPDFNPETVGIWNEFFDEPAVGTETRTVIRSRLATFLRRAFRGPVDAEVLDRYTDYTLGKVESGLSFTDAMRKVSAAALSSPLFLYRSSSSSPEDRQFVIASQLSYFLWGSCPDEELLQIAERGELLQPDVLNRTISRMLIDPKIERFLDSFPAQWMQLENLMAATPDPAIHPYFRVDPESPASLQMVLEPLLLFDAAYVEDRPLVELIAPKFGYRSEFLETWYETDLQPTPVDEGGILSTNQSRETQRQELGAKLSTFQDDLKKLVNPIREQILLTRQSQSPQASPPDLEPYAVWEFDGDLRESVRGLDLTAQGEIQFRDGMVQLDKSYLQSQPLPIDLSAKTLEVRFRLTNLDQRGGGLMGIQGRGDLFDTIVIGERKNRHWISGSNGFSRTDDFLESTEETETNDLIHLVMVYAEDGTTTLYRNGVPYGKPFHKGKVTFPKKESSVLFGLRHLPAGGNKFLSVRIDQARLYDRALTAEEVAAASDAANYVSAADLLSAMSPEQRRRHEQLVRSIAETASQLDSVPGNIDLNEAKQQAQRQHEQNLRRQLRSQTFRRLPITDQRYGGIITNAAVLSMTSGPKRTHPVARGVWIIEVVFNDPPAPPPNNVPPLDEANADQELTIREQFAMHRDHPSCAGCHTKLDPLGFALENFDITGRWRDKYDNGRSVDPSGTLLRRHDFDNVISFKQSLVNEQRRFAKSFTEHLFRYAVGRKLQPHDALRVDTVLDKCEPEDFRLRSLIREVILVALLPADSIAKATTASD